MPPSARPRDTNPKRERGTPAALSILEFNVESLLPGLDRRLERRVLLFAIRLSKLDPLGALPCLLQYLQTVFQLLDVLCQFLVVPLGDLEQPGAFLRAADAIAHALRQGVDGLDLDRDTDVLSGGDVASDVLAVVDGHADGVFRIAAVEGNHADRQRLAGEPDHAAHLAPWVIRLLLFSPLGAGDGQNGGKAG